jgi:NAD(P)-dependent dehydrogenase (short-subunit alcohol dehydrogenase family)
VSDSNELDTRPLQGRVALVTGAGRGIGRAIALALADTGANVGLVARTETQLQATAADAQSRGVRALPLVADLADRASVMNVASRTAEVLGTINILVNNAGVGASIDPRPVADFSDTTWDVTLAVNLTAPYLLCRAVLPAMIARQWGRIVNISSINARTGAAHGAAYAASKSGLLGLTRSLALEVAAVGITVNAVLPGPVVTLTSDRRLAQLAEERGIDRAEFEKTLTPIGRRLDPTEIARLVVFLALDASAGITGQAWHVDGGVVPA